MKTQSGSQAQTNYLTSQQFLQNTVFRRTPCVQNLPVVENTTLKIPIPQAGLGLRLMVAFNGIITVAGTITGGTWASYPNPMPFGLVKQMNFGNNQSVTMRSMSGWNWYRWARSRNKLDAIAQFASNNPRFSFGTFGVLGGLSTSVPFGGANVSAGAQNINFVLPIDLAFNKTGDYGMLVLQNNTIIYTLNLSIGAIASGIGATGGSNDTFTGLTGTGISVTYAISVTASLEWCDYLGSAMDNFLTMYMGVNDSSQALVQNVNQVIPPVNEVYTRFLFEVYNNGSQASIQSLSNLQMSHSSSVFPRIEDITTHVAYNMYDGGVVDPDGTVTYDFTTRRGIELSPDLYEAFNDSNVTGLNFKFTYSGTPAGANGINIVYEYLNSFNQPVS